VAETVEKVRYLDANTLENYPKRFGGEEYLSAWKTSGGHDIVEVGGAAVEEANTKTRTNMPTPFEERPATKSLH